MTGLIATSDTGSAVPSAPAPADPFAVHRIRPADAARMRALRLEMLADSPLSFIETLAQAAARSHREFQARVALAARGDDFAQFVADAGGRLVGHAGGIALPDEPGVTVIFAVYVSPPWRGTGVVGRLIEAVADWSRAVGRPGLLLEVVTGNDRAVRAYRRLGFADTGVRVPHPTVPTLTELQMRRAA